MENSQEAAELEALQTDVMRFIAILGLCLAAIFSLVHSASLEQAVVNPPVSQAQARPAPANSEAAGEAAGSLPSPVLQRAPQRPVSRPEAAPQRQGFTLEFSSARVLQSLLQSGEVQLYARRGDQFWSADARGSFVEAPAPGSYYRMQADTVPRRLRQSPGLQAASGDIVWGVTLPGGMIERIQHLTASREGGSLVIGKEGEVNLH